jgi:hypothetical protein
MPLPARCARACGGLLYSVGDDPLMVERDRQPGFKYVVGSRPPGVGSVRAGYRLRQSWCDREVRNGHYPASGIAPRIAVHAEFFEVEAVGVETGFLGQLAPGSVRDRLRRIPQEPAGQRHHPRVGFDSALHEEHVQGAVAQGQDHQVDGEENRRRSPFVVGHESIVTSCQLDSK